MSRTGQQRLDAIPNAIARRDEFLKRVKIAEFDAAKINDRALQLADLMSEAIDMLYEANGLETVGPNGKKTVCIEVLMADHCMFGARTAYLKARLEA